MASPVKDLILTYCGVNYPVMVSLESVEAIYHLNIAGLRDALWHSETQYKEWIKNVVCEG